MPEFSPIKTYFKQAVSLTTKGEAMITASPGENFSTFFRV